MIFQSPGRQHEAHGAPPQVYVQPLAVGKSTRSRGVPIGAGSLPSVISTVILLTAVANSARRPR
jgi:hypothetical protein